MANCSVLVLLPAGHIGLAGALTEGDAPRPRSTNWLSSADSLVAALGLQYRGPIHIGDTLHLEVETADKRLTSAGDRYVVDRRLALVNQDGTVV